MNVVQKTGVQGAANPLKALEQFGQSPWLDFIQRSYTENGSLKKLVDEDGLKGVTSNPAIFQKAMGQGTDYDPQYKDILAHRIVDAGTLYETMAIDDIKAATKVLFPVYEATKGLDGYVSLEVSPYLARDTHGTVEEARRLWKAVDAKNLMIKIPGTDEGAPAVRTVISEGLSINVTLLFSIDAYKKVLEAYIAGLEDRHAKGLPVSGIASVASFFVSRIDGKIDKKIDDRVAAGDKDAAALKALRGKVAIANAKVAYQHWLEVTKSARWQKLAAAGAQTQRLLWASTGTKDKTFSDVLYVEELIGPDTVNTIPPATFDAFRDHGKVRASLTEDVEGARHVMAEAKRLGLDLDGVTTTLVNEGVSSFADAFDDLLGSVATKQNALLGHALTTTTLNLPADIDAAVKASLDTWRKDGTVRRLWARDATVWTGKDESKWLKWLDIVEDRLADLPALEAFQAEVKQKGFKDILLLGMGGSSLGPEVLAETFGKHDGFPHLYVLDSTDPQQIKAFEKKVDLAHTLFIVSSKSGGTLEPNILKAYFFDAAKKVLGDKVGSHFVAVTDPGSHMEEVAKKDGFWKIFYGDKQIGGRYSVLSNFGIVPAAASGVPLKLFLDSALRGVKASAASVPPALNPGVVLGTVLGVAATQFGRDKVTFVTSHPISDMGAWMEQLLAESTGKIGRGLIPIDDETLGAPALYGKDRVFAYLRLDTDACSEEDEAVKALVAAGEPVVTIHLQDKRQIAQEFFHWEFATAVAGSILGIDAFDQPDVEASKIETKKLTTAYNETGKLPPETPFATDGAFSFFADATNAAALKGDSLAAILKAHFGRVKAGDYVGLLAYIERDNAHRAWIQRTRLAIRDALKVATAAEFGPRFLHSTGQAYKGGPNSGVFLQITADDAADLPVPGEKFTFGVVKAAQARGDFDVLAERGRRALRVHISGDLKSGLQALGQAITAAL
ncbi:bifunctional transaldolase/phosoglucose isomerase [Gluconacetobacter diazotrophicus]|uniref:Transaldolase n=2 Tax=Gluconacetobacter diazotrophicus TaxID=33996 RepID=A9H320_GLUDA|nr:bifunctional transaldolase/phosoglucose isomerase [Gluconacetobacter diazotrophicus]MBB2156977.1 bifunctional transaldolase/phosoglucose isomerase [Gluconacetobacter diazotrophicus]CAP54229.1 Transaldolase [Gluconacetobacter diazotrophicus PA1 5]